MVMHHSVKVKDGGPSPLPTARRLKNMKNYKQKQ